MMMHRLGGSLGSIEKEELRRLSPAREKSLMLSDEWKVVYVGLFTVEQLPERSKRGRLRWRVTTIAQP